MAVPKHETKQSIINVTKLTLPDIDQFHLDYLNNYKESHNFNTQSEAFNSIIDEHIYFTETAIPYINTAVDSIHSQANIINNILDTSNISNLYKNKIDRSIAIINDGCNIIDKYSSEYMPDFSILVEK